MISLFVEGTMNVLKHHGIVAGPMGRTGKDVTVFVGNSAYPILATAGGLVEHLVKLKDKVEAGQKVAIQRDSFGEVIAEYTSGVAGEITGQRSDALSEPGNPLVFILFNKATREALRSIPSNSPARATLAFECGVYVFGVTAKRGFKAPTPRNDWIGSKANVSFVRRHVC